MKVWSGYGKGKGLACLSLDEGIEWLGLGRGMIHRRSTN